MTSSQPAMVMIGSTVVEAMTFRLAAIAGMTSKAVKGDDLLIADIWADEGVLSFLDSLNSIWNGVGTYEAKRDLLTGVSGLLHSSTISDDGVRDKVKGDRETCRFSADTFSS